MFITKKSKHHHQSKKNTAASTTRQQAITHSSSKHHRTITETSPKHARDVTNTSLKDPQNTTKKPTKQHQNNTDTSPKKDRDRDMTESINFSILKHHPSTYGPQLHWFAQRCTIYKFKLEFWILLRNPIKCSSPKNQSTITKAKKTALQHQRHNTQP